MPKISGFNHAGWRVERIQLRVMHSSRWAQGWMFFGLLWFLLAIAFAATNKIYQRGLTLFLWLPAGHAVRCCQPHGYATGRVVHLVVADCAGQCLGLGSGQTLRL
jgi:hypothetical protein